VMFIRDSNDNPARRASSAVEQRFCKPLVGGSIPSPGTSFRK
jgi:hypothetical protein